MISEGDILLFRFPQSDLGAGKLRPALLIKRVPGDFGDCLVCMISTQTRHQIPELEVVLHETMLGFDETGLKKKAWFGRVGLPWSSRPCSLVSWALYRREYSTIFGLDWPIGFEVKRPSSRSDQLRYGSASTA